MNFLSKMHYICFLLCFLLLFIYFFPIVSYSEDTAYVWSNQSEKLKTVETSASILNETSDTITNNSLNLCFIKVYLKYPFVI